VPAQDLDLAPRGGIPDARGIERIIRRMGGQERARRHGRKFLSREFDTVDEAAIVIDTSSRITEECIADLLAALNSRTS
jgi:hypothetical protein